MPAGAQGSKEWTAQAAGVMLPVVAAFENGWAVSPAREAAIRAAVAPASPMRQPTGRMRINAKLNRERDLPRGHEPLRAPCDGPNTCLLTIFNSSIF
jgi:hypothetical protein